MRSDRCQIWRRGFPGGIEPLGWWWQIEDEKSQSKT